MSQSGTEKLVVPEIINNTEQTESQNKDVEIVEPKPPQTDTEMQVVVETEQNFERRMSMNSENNCDVNDSGVENLNSSQAEDNDEVIMLTTLTFQI